MQAFDLSQTLLSGEQFVLAVEQVEQCTLTEAELLLVRGAYFGAAIHVLLCDRQLLGGIVVGVPRQAQLFV